MLIVVVQCNAIDWRDEGAKLPIPGHFKCSPSMYTEYVRHPKTPCEDQKGGYLPTEIQIPALPML